MNKKVNIIYFIGLDNILNYECVKISWGYEFFLLIVGVFLVFVNIKIFWSVIFENFLF